MYRHQPRKCVSFAALCVSVSVYVSVCLYTSLCVSVYLCSSACSCLLCTHTVPSTTRLCDTQKPTGYFAIFRHLKNTINRSHLVMDLLVGLICQKLISVEGNGHCCHRPSSKLGNQLGFHVQLTTR